MYYIGVDYHKKYSYMVVKDQEGNLKDKGTVNNLQEEVEEFSTLTGVVKLLLRQPETGELCTTGWKNSWKTLLLPIR